MPALKNSSVLVGEPFEWATYLKPDGSVDKTTEDGWIVSEFGILYLTPSRNTKILIPWNRVVEIWF